jgi:O-antigen ligase
VLVLLVVVQVAYLAYYSAGITESLWSTGVYFSANDVLHVGMVIWLAVAGLFLWRPLRDRLQDSGH